MRSLPLIVLFSVACSFPQPARITDDATAGDAATDAAATIDDAAGPPADTAPGAPTDAAGMPSDAATDAPGQQPRCNPTKPFGAPTRVTNINSPLQELDFELTQDEKFGFVTRYTDLTESAVKVALLAQRALPEGDFGIPSDSATSAINAVANVFKVLPGATGREIYFSRETDPSMFQAGIYVSTRNDDQSSYDAGTLVTVDGFSTLNFGDPILSGDGQTLYFIADSHRFAADRVTRSAFVHKRFVGDWTHRSVLSADELTLYTAEFVGSSADVMVATRSVKSAAFGAEAPVTTVNSSDDEVPVWITRDSCVLYLSSNRRTGGADGTNEIWEARRPM